MQALFLWRLCSKALQKEQTLLCVWIADQWHVQSCKRSFEEIANNGGQGEKWWWWWWEGIKADLESWLWTKKNIPCIKVLYILWLLSNLTNSWQISHWEIIKISSKLIKYVQVHCWTAKKKARPRPLDILSLPSSCSKHHSIAETFVILNLSNNH